MTERLSQYGNYLNVVDEDGNVIPVDIREADRYDFTPWPIVRHGESNRPACKKVSKEEQREINRVGAALAREALRAARAARSQAVQQK